MRHHYWEWYIPSYLFLGGLGGGIMFLSMILSVFIYPGSEAVVQSLWLPVFFALACIAVGCLFLVLDLGQPLVFYRAFVKNKSVIAWGARCLTVCMIFALLWWLSAIPMVPPIDCLQPIVDVFSVIRVPSMVLSGLAGACVMIYTGAMLSTLKAHSWWATPALPVLFTVSATSTGCAGIMIFAGIHPLGNTADVLLAAEGIRHFVHTGDIILVFAELFVLLTMVLSFLGAGNKVQNAAAHRWIHGSYALPFWGGMILCGLVIPQCINLFCGEIPLMAHIIGPLFVLFGGCLLRFLCIQSDDRAEVPGENKYFLRLKKKGEAEFLTRWEYGKNEF